MDEPLAKYKHDGLAGLAAVDNGIPIIRTAVNKVANTKRPFLFRVFI
jgi:hypothetical protein